MLFQFNVSIPSIMYTVSYYIWRIIAICLPQYPTERSWVLEKILCVYGTSIYAPSTHVRGIIPTSFVIDVYVHFMGVINQKLYIYWMKYIYIWLIIEILLKLNLNYLNFVYHVVLQWYIMSNLVFFVFKIR